MSEDGRLDLVGYETFNDVLDYPVSAHPIKDGDDLLFHSYTVDKKLIEDHGTMKLGRYNSQAGAVETYFVPTPSKSYVSFAHSIISTDNYIITGIAPSTSRPTHSSLAAVSSKATVLLL